MLCNCRMIWTHQQPVTMVEREWFTDFISKLQHLYKYVSQFIVARDCVKMYVSEKVVLKKTMYEITNCINQWYMCVSIQNQGYLRLAVHFIDDG